MFTPEIYKGIIVDNKDPQELGRLQVRVSPELKDVEVGLLPWMRPFLYQDIVNSPLDIGTQVWCIFIDEFWKDGYWISNQFIDIYYDYDEVIASVSNIQELDAPEYPQPFFKKYSDGTTLFHNSITSDTGIYSPKGSYALINKSGDIIFSNAGNKQTISSTLFEIKSSSIVNIVSADGFNYLKFDAPNNAISIVASGEIYNKANFFAIEASKKAEKIGTVELTYTSLNERTTGSKVEVVGGNKITSIVGKSQTTVWGKYDSLHLGDWKVSVTNPLSMVELSYMMGLMKINISALGITIDAGLLPVAVRGSIITLG